MHNYIIHVGNDQSKKIEEGLKVDEKILIKFDRDLWPTSSRKGVLLEACQSWPNVQRYVGIELRAQISTIESELIIFKYVSS